MLMIPMKVVLELGEGRYQLRCMCGTDFTFAPAEKLNTTDEQRAMCPNCKSKWDGNGEMINPYVKFYSLSVKLKESKEDEGTVELKVIGVGSGYDMFHFITRMTSQINNFDLIECLLIKEINQTEYEKVEEYFMKKNSMNSFMGMIGQMMGMFREGE